VGLEVAWSQSSKASVKIRPQAAQRRYCTGTPAAGSTTPRASSQLLLKSTTPIGAAVPPQTLQALSAVPGARSFAVRSARIAPASMGQPSASGAGRNPFCAAGGWPIQTRCPPPLLSPVIDFAAPPQAVCDAVARACADWGFFHLVGHGLDPALQAEAMAEAAQFFAAPADPKRALARSRENPWGYYDRELTKNRRDKKEIFDIGPDLAGRPAADDVFYGETPFPDWQPNLKPAARDWFDACEGLCFRLLDPVARGLGAPAEALADAFRGVHTSFLRLNHYPVGDPADATADRPAGLGIHHHTDAGALTVLLTDGKPGLEVLHGDAWRPVDAVPGGLIINIGDMVQVWSNDAYRAPLHRVLAMEADERLSLAYFFNPAYAAVIAPLRADTPHYRDISWSEFRRRRAEGDFADYGAEVQISDYRVGA
jgi:isopenicillin N synthase-like dioxygenase